MRKTQYILILFLSICAGTLIYGQERKVLVRSGEKGVWVRWTRPDLNLKNGINVYRQESGSSDWTKVNANPENYGNPDLIALLDRDPEMKKVRELTDQMRKKGQLEGLGLLLVLVNMIEDRNFAQYTGTLYHDQTVEKGKTYRYEVKEVLANRENSYGQSTEVQAGKFKPASAPQKFESKDKKNRVLFRWDPDEENLAGAYLYFKTNQNRNWRKWSEELIIPSKQPSETGISNYPAWLASAENLTVGATYTFRIHGVDKFGFETLPTSEVEITVKDVLVPAPKGVKLLAEGKKVQVKWEPPLAKNLTGFEVFRRPLNDTNWVKLTQKPLPRNASSFEDEIKETGLPYFYRVAALNTSDDPSFSPESAVQIPDLQAPKPITGLKAEADTGIVRLSWNPGQEPDLYGYMVYRITQVKGSDQKDTIRISDFVKEPRFDDELPINVRNKFSYLVKAVDTVNNQSRWSRPITAQLPDIVPPGPPFLTGIQLDGEALFLTWLPNLESDLAGYQVYRATSETTPDSLWEQVNRRMLSSRDTSWRDLDCEAGQPYYYRITALDDAGNQSDRSDVYQGVVNKKRLKAVPKALEVTFKKKTKTAFLTWEAPENDKLIGFMVYRKQADQSYFPVSGLLQTKEFQDPNLKAGQTYYYQVKAFDEIGNTAGSRHIQLKTE